MTNKKLTLVESIASLRGILADIEEGKGVNFGIDLLGTGALKAAKKLGNTVRTVGSNGEVEIWEQIPNTTTYALTSRTGMGGQAVKKEADELLKIRDDQIARGLRPEPGIDKTAPARAAEPGDELGSILKQIDEHKRSVETMVKTGGKVHLTNTQMAEMIAKGMTFEEAMLKFYPDAVAKMKANPAKEKQFWSTVEEKARTNKKINVKAILIALGLLALLAANKDKIIPKSDKQDNPAADMKATDAEEGAAVGTVIPGDEMPWGTVLGDKAPKEIIDRLKGQGVTKQEDGKWYSKDGSSTSNPEVIKRIEQIAKADSNYRKSLVQYDDAQKVDLYSAPPEVAPVNPSSGDEKADIAVAPSEPASSPVIKKKKKDEKVLPASKW